MSRQAKKKEIMELRIKLGKLRVGYLKLYATNLRLIEEIKKEKEDYEDLKRQVEELKAKERKGILGRIFG